jgi:hypothetical protein
MDSHIARHLAATLESDSTVSVGSISSKETLGGIGPMRTTLVFALKDLSLAAALLVTEYKHPQTIYIQKLDSTLNRLPGLARELVTAYLLLGGKVHLFARARDQYLFHNSANSGKHIMNGSNLVKWWTKTLNRQGN